MVCAGQSCANKYSPEEIALATVRVLQRTVPAAVPGIAFLSGGQGEEDATLNLNAINRIPGIKPWRLTFSYARALQNTVIKTWAGLPENDAKAKQVLLERAKRNSEASLGKYEGGKIQSGAQESLFEKDYRY